MGIGPAASLQDAIELLDQALEAPAGIEVTFTSQAGRIVMRQRLYAARKADRLRSIKIYEPGTPGYGASVWDCLVMVMKGEFDLQIIKSSLDERRAGISGIKRI